MRAIRILQSNWLNDEVGGDRNTVKSVSDEMARDAVEVHHIAEYAPEWDQPADAVVRLDDSVPEKPVVIEFPAERPASMTQPVDFSDDELLSVLDDDLPVKAELKMPWSNASKADWITWAAHGDHGQPHVSEEVAATMTKNELMSRYGERL